MHKNEAIYEEIKPFSKYGLGLDELWRFRELFYFYSLRYIKVRYKHTILGVAWALLQPLFMMLLFTYFFGKRLGVSSGDLPYPVFVFTGLLVWNIFSNGITSTSNSVLDNSHIIKKIYFPRLIIPVSAVMVSLFDFLMTFIIYLMMLFFFQVHIDLIMFASSLFFALILTTLSTLGLGCFFAALNIRFRDLKYLIPYMVQALLFISPIIYPSSIITDPTIRLTMALNPLFSAIGLLRYSLGGPVVDMLELLISSVSCLLLLIFGIVFFRKSEPFFADNA